MNEVSLSASEPVVAAEQLGRQLAAARERCEFSVADVARQLKLTPAQVEAMEAGDLQRLPGPVFVRGFIRNYARLVKLDLAPPLLPSAEQPSPPPASPEPALLHSEDIPFPTGRTFKWRNYAIAALLAIAALATYEFYRNDAGNNAEKSGQADLPPPQVATEQKSAQTAVDMQVTVVDDTPTQAARAPAAVMDVEKTKREKMAAVSPAAEAQAGRKPSERLVRLSFDRESWVEIRDRYGRKIFSRLNHAGTEQAVSGEPPLTLVVGNAAGVRLTLNDQPVDLAPHIKVDVARLTLE